MFDYFSYLFLLILGRALKAYAARMCFGGSETEKG